MIKYQFAALFMSPQWHGAGYPSELSYTLLGSLYADLFYSLPQYIKMSLMEPSKVKPASLGSFKHPFYKYPVSSCHKPQKPCLCLVLAFSCHAPPQIVACPPLPISSQPQLPPPTIHQKLISIFPTPKNEPCLHSVQGCFVFFFSFCLMIHFSVIHCFHYVETLVLVW